MGEAHSERKGHKSLCLGDYDYPLLGMRRNHRGACRSNSPRAFRVGFNPGPFLPGFGFRLRVNVWPLTVDGNGSPITVSDTLVDGADQLDLVVDELGAKDNGYLQCLANDEVGLYQTTARPNSQRDYAPEAQWVPIRVEDPVIGFVPYERDRIFWHCVFSDTIGPRAGIKHCGTRVEGLTRGSILDDDLVVFPPHEEDIVVSGKDPVLFRHPQDDFDPPLPLLRQCLLAWCRCQLEFFADCTARRSGPQAGNRGDALAKELKCLGVCLVVGCGLRVGNG